jgi:uncharacterized protein (UPF0147 family)
VKITQATIRQIIKEELNNALNENWSGEDKWSKAKDSDFKLGKNNFLIILDKKHLASEYPKNDGQNHGMVSHAIKHSKEFQEIDIESDLGYFNSIVQELLASGKDIYIKNKKGQFKINKTILELIKNLKKVPKENRQEKKEIKQKLANEANVDVKKIDAVAQIYTDKLVPSISNLKIQDFMMVLDFYHDIGDMNALDFFDGELINKYKELTDKFLEDNKEDFKTDPSDQFKKVAVKKTGNTNSVAIVYDDKIATFYADKDKSNPEEFFKKK